MPLAAEPNTGNRWTPRGTGATRPSKYAQYFMHGHCYRSQNLPSKCLLYPHQQLGETKSLWKVDSTRAQWWPKSHKCSCHHLSAMKEKWRQCIPSLHFNSWCVMDAFIGPSAETKECWMVCPNITKEENCMVQSGCSENHACRVLQPKDCTNPCQLVQWSVANITMHSCRIRWGGSSPLTTRTAGAWCHFVQGQCNTCHFLSKRNIW